MNAFLAIFWRDMTLGERWVMFVVLTLALFSVFKAAFEAWDMLLGPRVTRWLTRRGVNADDLYEDDAIGREAEAARLLAQRAAEDEACREVVRRDLQQRRAAMRLVAGGKVH